MTQSDDGRASGLGDTLGRRIQERRHAQNLTQAQLAEIADIKVDALSSYERDVRRPRHNTLQLIAKSLKTTTEALLSGLGTARNEGRAPTIDAMRILRVADPLAWALEALLVNRSSRAVAIHRMRLDCVAIESARRWMPLPRHTYEMRLTAAGSGERLQIEGGAAELGEPWQRPVSGHLSTGDRPRLHLECALYLRAAPGDQGLLRVVLAAPELVATASTGSAHVEVGDAPSGTRLMLEGDFEPPMRAEIDDVSLLGLFPAKASVRGIRQR